MMETEKNMTRRVRHICALCILGGLCMFLTPVSGHTQGWQAHIASYPYSPDSLFAIDKSKQTLFYFRMKQDKSGLDLIRKIPCATGKIRGDKFREGDLKTPEGIYFIQGKKDSGLDYSLYGDLAFTLNFPNPVDQVNGKTGHGIWMHGRGKPIGPFETKGCVALNNEDIHQIRSGVHLKSTPVVISDGFSWNPDSIETVDANNHLIELTRTWADAWDHTSPAFFSFYDQRYFSKKFKRHKQKLFKKYAWIDLFIDQIRCIKGPDYFVTYFKQLYEAPHFFSEGIKRLYWKKNSQGAWKIIGTEWFGTPIDLQEKYQQKVAKNIEVWLEKWRSAWNNSDIDGYATYYSKNARQGNLKGRQAICNHKRLLQKEGKAPEQIVFGVPNIVSDGHTVTVIFTQDYRSQTGYSDKGIKKIKLVRIGDNSWNIISEEWSTL